MRKKIIGMSVVIALLAILCAQSVIAQPPSVPGVTVYVWTDKPQYKPGEKGTLKISVLNERDEPIEVRNITIEYPWFTYDAKAGQWVGNETIKLEPAEILASEGGHYYREVEFTVPTDGRATMEDKVTINIGTSKGTATPTEPVNLLISSISVPMSIAGLDTWMTTLTVAIVICTIIIAAVVFLSARRPTIHTIPAERAKAS